MPPLVPRVTTYRQRLQMACPLGGVLQASLVRQLRPVSPRPWRQLDRFALVLVLAGEGRYGRPGMDQPLTPGDLITVLPGEPHAYGPGPSGWDELFLVFDGPVFRAWLASGVLSAQRPVHRLGAAALWRSTLERVLCDDPVEELIRLQQVLGQLVDRPPRDSDWAVQLDALIDRHRLDELDVAGMARALELSEASLRRRLKQRWGVTPRRYQTMRTMDRACRLLADPGLTLDAIAGQLGFADAFHFSRRFKQLAGQSPSDYRRAIGAATTP